MAALLQFLRPDWPALPGVRALSTTRAGGSSAAPFTSLNLGAHVGDAPTAVKANREQLRIAALLPAEPTWLTQVHGVAVADLDTNNDDGIVADAAIASLPGRVCVVMTADCLPVTLAAADGSAVAAIHAGWRGLAAGVVEAGVQALRARASRDVSVQAWLGPAIGLANFEVGEEVRAAFLRQDLQAAQAFTPNASGRWQCDLYGLARQRLRAQGITAISGGNFCTYADARRFYSHRRDVQHEGRASTGRMATLIWRM